MSDLRIKPNTDNGDLPKKFDGHGVEKLHKVIDRKIKILEDSNKLQDELSEKLKPWKDTVSAKSDEFRVQLMDIFNPTVLREKLEKDNGQK